MMINKFGCRLPAAGCPLPAAGSSIKSAWSSVRSNTFNRSPGALNNFESRGLPPVISSPLLRALYHSQHLYRMTSKLIPSDPSKVMVIRQITPNITTCSVPFLRFGRLKIGGRGTIGMTIGALSITLLMCVSSTPPVRRSRSLLSHRSYTGSPLYNWIHGE